ncbi:MAG: hypothetical protein AB7L66_01510 [Gemmatimonadales bacterium]
MVLLVALVQGPLGILPGHAEHLANRYATAGRLPVTTSHQGPAAHHGGHESAPHGPAGLRTVPPSGHAADRAPDHQPAPTCCDDNNCLCIAGRALAAPDPAVLPAADRPISLPDRLRPGLPIPAPEVLTNLPTGPPRLA